jgi:hypothetical protein
MEVGLLWYDDSNGDLASKVQEAAERYREKFGRRPDRCYVNPASVPGTGKGVSLDGIKVVASPTILPNHFWVGVEGRKRLRKQ